MFDTLGRIKELREAKGWSVYKLAKLSGIPQSSIATWYGKNLCPPIDKLEIICKTLGISLSEFFADGTLMENTSENRDLIRWWQSLSFHQKESVLSLISAFEKQP